MAAAATTSRRRPRRRRLPPAGGGVRGGEGDAVHGGRGGQVARAAAGGQGEVLRRLGRQHHLLRRRLRRVRVQERLGDQGGQGGVLPLQRDCPRRGAAGRHRALRPRRPRPGLLCQRRPRPLQHGAAAHGRRPRRPRVSSSRLNLGLGAPCVCAVR
ncbi:hypothetical protein PVAP13_1NG124519 [Panicum virgatum]|uniref:Uncharacterized protein n=1 Tax=Panicum virgatum TaxID=38727 RepID=A0A8T0WVI5_PANVG|nr:hypothetical protein PVAP13_1NG124519 [Panicum virgatum]